MSRLLYTLFHISLITPLPMSHTICFSLKSSPLLITALLRCFRPAQLLCIVVENESDIAAFKDYKPDAAVSAPSPAGKIVLEMPAAKETTTSSAKIYPDHLAGFTTFDVKIVIKLGRSILYTQYACRRVLLKFVNLTRVHYAFY